MLIAPYECHEGGCFSTDWKSFRYELDPAQLHSGENTFTWSVGPRPDCEYPANRWDGFSVNFLQIQTDAKGRRSGLIRLTGCSFLRAGPGHPTV